MELAACVESIIRLLGKKYPDPHCALHHRNPLELLVATILSAQCTDERVNQVTPGLFRKYPDAAAFARAPLPELEEAIRSTGFFRNKARNIQNCCRQLVTLHGGQIPDSMEALVQLPGVARKTANVVLGEAFGIADGIVVDTHVLRLSMRLGLTRQTQPEKVERDLMALVPRDRWIPFAHWLIFHGRETCQARKPACDRCLLRQFCPRIGVP
jgi:endonuclease-3